MRSVKKFALALVVGGLSAAPAWAQNGPNFAGYPPAPASAGPGLLPLPELSTNWNGGSAYPVVQSANYASAPSEPLLDPSTGPGNYQPHYAPGSAPSPSASDRSGDVYGAALGCSGCNGGNGPEGCGGLGGYGCGCGQWFGYSGGIIMTRNQPNKVWVAYNQANNSDQV